jgi:hypothetical protein
MKKVIVFLMLAIFAVACCPKANAQVTTQPEKITVNASDLTVDQLAKIKAQQEVETLQKKLETYGKWVGVGGEIGNAVKEGLNAVVDVSDKFGKTDVGRFTMVMVAWKIIGKDLVRIALGLLFIIIFTFVLLRSYKNYCTRRILIKSNGWKFWLPKEYQVVKPESFDGFQFVKILHVFLMIGAFGITYAIMFA